MPRKLLTIGVHKAGLKPARQSVNFGGLWLAVSFGTGTCCQIGNWNKKQHIKIKGNISCN